MMNRIPQSLFDEGLFVEILFGVMRQYERGPDGTWHDGVLMESLAEDLSGAT